MAPTTHLAVALSTFGAAHAWGTLGHATVAYVAQNYMTDAAVTWAQGILGDSSGAYLASVASWADEYRATDEGAYSAPWHYIDAEDDPPASCGLDYDRDCGEEGCSVSAIANMTRRVSDETLEGGERAQALKFLVHLLGDVTQPLHDEAYEVGGNGIDVVFDGYDDNLHADWDTWIPEKIAGSGSGGDALSDAEAWAAALAKEIDSGVWREQAAGWVKGDDPLGEGGLSAATRWAADANAFVCSVVMPDGAAALQQGDLFPDYYDAVAPTVELQLAKGGYRLANWLNQIAAEAEGGSSSGSRRSPSPDLLGRDLLPPPRPLSRAKLARAAMGYDCGHKH